MADDDDIKVNDSSSGVTCRTQGFAAAHAPTRRQYRDMGNSAEYLAKKLAKDPSMARYNHCLAAIYSEVGNDNMADVFFKNAIMNAPGDVMTRNDYALHLSRLGYTEEATDELKKGQSPVTLITSY